MVVSRFALALLIPAAILSGCSKHSTMPLQPSSASSRWVSIGGPSTEEVFAVAPVGASLIAGTRRGILRSTDQGDTWRLVRSDQTFAFGSAGSVLFAGSWPSPVLRSTDGGTTWNPAFTGIPSGYAGVGFAAHEGAVLAAVNGVGVYRSIDLGDHWEPASDGIDTRSDIRTLLARGSDLFAGTDQGEISRSIDGGHVWTHADAGLPSGRRVFSLLARGTELFAGLEGGDVYVSTDDGGSWSRATDQPLDARVSALANVADLVLAATDRGLYQSSNGRSPWTRVPTGSVDNPSVWQITSIGTTIFAATEGRGLLRSVVGTDWSTVGPPSDAPGAGEVHDQLFAGTDAGGIYRSIDGGRTWDVTSQQTGWASSFAANGSGFVAVTSLGVMRSNDGQAWSPAVDPFGGQVHEIVSNGTTLVAAVDYRSIARSVDNGDSWQGVSRGTVIDVATSGGRFFAATSLGLERSDDGATWTLAQDGLPLGTGVLALAATEGRVYVAVRGRGVFVSTSGGDHWSATGMTSGAFTGLFVSGSKLVGVSITGDVWKSSDAGSTWSVVSDSPPLRSIELSTGDGTIPFYTNAMSAGPGGFDVGTDHGVSRLSF